MQELKSVHPKTGKAPWRSLALAFMVLPFLTVSELIADIADLFTSGTTVTAVVEAEEPAAPLGGGEGDNGDPGTPHP